MGPHPAFKDTWATSLSVHPSDERILYVTTGKPYVPNSIFRSDDGGETWKELVALNADTRYSALRIAPTEPAADLCLGPVPNNELFLMRSDDAGQTWTRLPQPFSQFQTPYDFVVMLVSPQSAGRPLGQVSAQGGCSYFLKSTDGGATFVRAMDVPTCSSARRARPTAAPRGCPPPSTSTGAATARPSPSCRCPRATRARTRVGDVLYGCGSSWLHDWALARSTDEGTTWQPIFGLYNIQGAHVCAEGTPVQQACPSRWPQMAAQHQRHRRPHGRGGSGRWHHAAASLEGRVQRHGGHGALRSVTPLPSP